MKAKNKSCLSLSILLMFLFVVFSTGCSRNEDLPTEIELIVASKKVMSKDWGGVQIERNVVKEEGGQWQILFSLMPGFVYEDGYEYRLKVRKIVPSPDVMDAYTSYELISQISKEKKETIFQSRSYRITNNAKAEGRKLTSDEIAAIESKIKHSSPFNGVTSLTLEYRDFYGGGVFDKDFIYRTDTGKSGNGKIITDEDIKAVIYSFDFNGSEVKYEYQHVGSPTSPQYLFIDLTSEYKTDYPNLEEAKSQIGIKPIL